MRPAHKSVLIVLFIFSQGNDSHVCDGQPCQCTADDWDCYRPAQKNVSPVVFSFLLLLVLPPILLRLLLQTVGSPPSRAQKSGENKAVQLFVASTVHS